MIVDCIVASYEHDALAVRAAELEGVVDLRVVAWGSESFRGGPAQPLPSPMPGATRTYVEVFTFPGVPASDPWAREHALRQRSLDLGRRLGGDDALLLLCDGDEVPHPRAVLHAATSGPSLLPVDYREWYLDWRAPDEWNPPHQPLAGRYADFEALGGATEARAATPWPAAPHRGWHLSTLGDGAMAAAKVASFSHSEYDNEEHNRASTLEDRRRDGRDFLDRFDLEWAADLPSCAPRFPHLLARGPRR